MTLASGDRFGLYEIVALVGVGGMGEVYRARDTRLHRDVALKLVTESRQLSGDLQQRFEREARLLASLNHPNIATLHGLETAGDRQALVMELVEGESLERKIARRARLGLPIGDALEVARQLADALDAAHERGIVHRDLKPANVMVRADGNVKILDFGIAKAFDVDGAGHRGTTVAATQLGTVIGTPSYMSPEQAQGGTVDRRTDIWAFGCVLYEMLTGRRAFDGDTASAISARVLEREPDFGALPPAVPPAIRTLLRRCLAKDPRKRQRDAGDLRLDLEQALAEPAVSSAARSSPRWWIAAAVAFGLLSLGLLAVQWYSRAAPVSGAVRFAVYAPDRGRFETSLATGSNAPVGGNISPDGKVLAFTARGSAGNVLLWVRSLDSIDARALPGTEDAALPSWSPDSKSIAYFAQGKLKRIDVAGGEPQALADIMRGQGAAWGGDGRIVYAPALRSNLWTVDALGGRAVEATMLDAGDLAHRFPQWLPGGRNILYHVDRMSREESGVYVAALGSTTSRRLLAADSGAIYAEPGFLLYVRAGNLFAQRFDADRLELSGAPTRIAQGVPFEGSATAFSVSRTGVLTYRTGPADSDRLQIAWFDRAGKVLQVIGPPGTYRGIDLSPDGARIAVHDHQGDGGDIWIYEPRGTATRATFDPSRDNASPIWSPDGRRIAFGALRDGKWGLYVRTVDGDAEELLLESELPKIPASWTPDGGSLVYWLYDPQRVQQWVLPLTGESRTPAPAINSRFSESHAQVSPDGRWVAYTSTPSGRAEIYVRRFPAGQRVVQVSSNGGFTPRWRADGKELYYMTSFDHGKVVAVPVDTATDDLSLGEPQELFQVEMAIVPHSTVVQNFHTYGVSPDGQRFVFAVPSSTLSGEGSAGAIAVVLGWTALLGQ